MLNSRHYAFQWPTNYARGTRGASVPENRGAEGKVKERERERESRDVWKAKVCSMGGRLFRSWRATIHGFEDGAGIPQELNRA